MNNLNIARLNIGSGGGGRSPAAPSEIVQSLRSTTDGEFVADSVGVLDEPRYTGIPCLAFDGASYGLGSFDPGTADFSMSLCDIVIPTVDAGTTQGVFLNKYGQVAGSGVFIRLIGQTLDAVYYKGDGTGFAVAVFGSYLPYFNTPNTITAGRTGNQLWIEVNGSNRVVSATAVDVPPYRTNNTLIIGARGVSTSFAPAGTRYACIDCQSTIERVLYPFEEGAGNVFYNSIANANHGTISTGDLTTMRAARRNVGTSWNALKGFRLATVGAYDNVQIPALASGASAANGAALTNPGGFVHNGGIYGVKQVDPLFYKGPIVVSGTGTDADGTWEYFCEFEGRGEWHLTGSPSAVLSAQGSSWVIEDTGFYFAIASTAPLPPKTGWGADETGDGLAPILTYDAGFYAADDGTFASKSYADYLAHYEASNGADNLWVKLLSPTVLQADQYNFAKVFTTSETNRNLAYYGGAL
jgi:hypothetical protein